MAQNRKTEGTPIVYLREDRTFGVMEVAGAHFSYIRYSYGGIEYSEWIENDDFIIYDNIIFEVEDEEE